MISNTLFAFLPLMHKTRFFPTTRRNFSLASLLVFFGGLNASLPNLIFSLRRLHHLYIPVWLVSVCLFCILPRPQKQLNNCSAFSPEITFILHKKLESGGPLKIEKRGYVISKVIFNRDKTKDKKRKMYAFTNRENGGVRKFGISRRRFKDPFYCGVIT